MTTSVVFVLACHGLYESGVSGVSVLCHGGGKEVVSLKGRFLRYCPKTREREEWLAYLWLVEVFLVARTRDNVMVTIHK